VVRGNSPRPRVVNRLARPPLGLTRSGGPYMPSVLLRVCVGGRFRRRAYGQAAAAAAGLALGLVGECGVLCASVRSLCGLLRAGRLEQECSGAKSIVPPLHEADRRGASALSAGS